MLDWVKRAISSADEISAAEDFNSQQGDCEGVAKLPVSQLFKGVAEMPIDSWGYTVHWAIVVDTDMNCFLKRGSPAEKQCGGTLDTVVKRDGFGYYHAVVPSKHVYTPESFSPKERKELIPLRSIRFVIK